MWSSIFLSRGRSWSLSFRSSFGFRKTSAWTQWIVLSWPGLFIFFGLLYDGHAWTMGRSFTLRRPLLFTGPSVFQLPFILSLQQDNRPLPSHIWLQFRVRFWPYLDLRPGDYKFQICVCSNLEPRILVAMINFSSTWTELTENVAVVIQTMSFGLKQTHVIVFTHR